MHLRDLGLRHTCMARRPGNQRVFRLPLFTGLPARRFHGDHSQSQNLNFKQGRVQQFNVNVEHQLTGPGVLTAGYAGSRSLTSWWTAIT
jgi:hypothetical protein